MCADLEVGSLATEMYWLLQYMGQPQSICTSVYVDPIIKTVFFFFVVYGRSIPAVHILTKSHQAGDVS